jgi:hypothetical protein
LKKNFFENIFLRHFDTLTCFPGCANPLDISNTLHVLAYIVINQQRVHNQLYMTDAALTEVTLTDIQAESLPVSATVVAGDDRPSKWYFEQAKKVLHADPDHCAKISVFLMMGRHKRKLEQAADDMLILEQIFNSSLTCKRKRRMIDRVDDGFIAQMRQDYGHSGCEHN